MVVANFWWGKKALINGVLEMVSGMFFGLFFGVF